MEGRAPVNMIISEDDFARLVWSSKGKFFFYKEVQLIKLCPPVNTSCPADETIDEIPCSYLAMLYYMSWECLQGVVKLVFVFFIPMQDPSVTPKQHGSSFLKCLSIWILIQIR